MQNLGRPETEDATITVFSQRCDDQKAKGVIHGAYMTLDNPGAGLVDSRRALAVLVIEKNMLFCFICRKLHLS